MTALATDEPAIVVRRARLRGAPLISVHGELDVSTAGRLEEALDGAIRETRGPLVLDLTEVAFIDSITVGVLLRARSLLGREDRTVAVVCPPGHVRRVLWLAGIDDLFALYDDREAVGSALQ